MAKLFDIQRNRVTLSPDMLAIPIFKKIWESDKSKIKENALKQISYIVFMYDFHSPYRDINNADKEAMILTDLYGKGKKWKPTELIEEGIAVYKKLQKTRHSKMLEALEHTEEEITYYFNSINLKEGVLDDMGKPLYNISEVVKNAKELGNIIKSISVLEKQVKLELEEQSVQGDAAIGYFEDKH